MEKIEREKYGLELQNLKTYIENNLDFPGEVVRTPIDSIDSLAVALEPDDKGRNRVASLTFLPIENSDFEAIKLLQFYCELPFNVDEKYMEDLRKFLLTANLKMPIGSFALNEEDVITLKYIYSLGKFTHIDRDEFLETFLLWMFMLDGIGELVEAVATGQKNLETACKELED